MHSLPKLLMLCCLTASSALAKQADPELQLPRADKEKQLYAANGYQLRKCNFNEGTQIVIFFYSASLCVYCKEIAKQLEELYPSLRSHHPQIQFVTYSMDSSVSGRAAHLRKTDYPWPAIGPAAADKDAWKIKVDGGIPQFQAFALKEDGLVAISPTGPADEVLQAAIAHLK